MPQLHEDLEATFEAVREFFLEQVLPGLAIDPIEFAITHEPMGSYNAYVSAITTNLHKIEIFDGCIQKLYDAIDIDDVELLQPLAAITESLLGSSSEIDTVMLFLFECALTFCMLHEVAHVVAGHLRARGLDRAGEVEPAPVKLAFAFSATDEEASAMTSVFELEADATAHDKLMQVAVDIFLATPGVADAVASRSAGPDITQQDEIQVRKLCLFSAGIAVALTELARRSVGVQSHYPAAATRLLSILVSNVIASLPGEWRLDGWHHVHWIDDVSEAFVRDHLAPAVRDALSLCRAALAAVGIIETAHMIPDESVSARVFAQDLCNLLLDQRDDLTSETARAFDELERTRTALLDRLAAFRLSDWWSKGEPARIDT